LAIVVAASFLFWVYAFSGLAKDRPPDKLRDPAFSKTAEALCRAAMDKVAQLPPANTARTPAERADTVDQANGYLTALVADLRRVPTTSPDDAKLVDRWLADWESLLQSRRQYAQDVRTNPRARFYVDERQAQAITEPMDNLAAVNRMASCATPDDVG
jgi:hypothetical protein